jgi:hypothetical protein
MVMETPAILAAEMMERGSQLHRARLHLAQHYPIGNLQTAEKHSERYIQMKNS